MPQTEEINHCGFYFNTCSIAGLLFYNNFSSLESLEAIIEIKRQVMLALATNEPK